MFTSRSLAMAAVAVVAFCGTAAAQAPRWPDGFHRAMMARYTLIDAPNPADIDGYGPIRLGAIELAFGNTLLPELAIKLGGEVRKADAGFDQFNEICYVPETGSVPLPLSESSSEGRFNALAVEHGPALEAWQCAQTDLALSIDLPGLGASASQVHNIFGEDDGSGDGMIFYDDDSAPLYRAVTYAVEDDTVVAYALLEIAA